MTEFHTEFVERIQKSFTPGALPLHEPVFNVDDEQAVLDAIRSTFVSSVGRYTLEFEEKLSSFTGAKFAILTSSGTSALTISLISAGIRPGDEVIVPALSFVATANAVSHLGATPHFVDVESETLGIDPEQLADYLKLITISQNGSLRNRYTSRPITALVALHCFGNPARLSELSEIAGQYNLTLIEDAAEGLGSLIGRNHVGTLGTAGILSFNGNKIITTGGGGAVLTNDPRLADHARHISTTARVSTAIEIEHDEIAFNYRMPNLNAALGTSQISRIHQKLRAKRLLAKHYRSVLEKFEELDFFAERDGAKSNYWLNAILLKNLPMGVRDNIITSGRMNGVEFRPAWSLLPKQPMYRSHPSAPIPKASVLQPRILCLPSGPGLADRIVN